MEQPPFRAGTARRIAAIDSLCPPFIFCPLLDSIPEDKWTDAKNSRLIVSISSLSASANSHHRIRFPEISPTYPTISFKPPYITLAARRVIASMISIACYDRFLAPVPLESGNFRRDRFSFVTLFKLFFISVSDILYYSIWFYCVTSVQC